jgi:transposase
MGSAVEIITGVERRRRWRPEEKSRVLAELETPGASVAEVARRHDISRSLLWGWRRQARRRLGPGDTGAGFLPMRIAPDSMPLAPAHSVRSEANSDSAIEIRLSDGTTLRVGSDVSAAALRRVLTALRG